MGALLQGRQEGEDPIQHDREERLGQFRELSPDDRADRSRILSDLLYELSATNDFSDESLDRMAGEVEAVYSDGYRQQYSDLLNMLFGIEEKIGPTFSSQDLCNSLEQLSEHIRTSREADGSYRYSTDAFLGITKLADHISLEFQRDDDYRILMEGIRRSRSDLTLMFNDIEKAKKTVRKARREAQSSKMELVAILSIFAALVIAFSGGLTYLGSTISSSGDASIGTTVFAVLICGLMLFNIVAFLMVMVIVIVRLNRDEGEPIMPRRAVVSIAAVVTAFDVILLAAIWLTVASGLVAIRCPPMFDCDGPYLKASHDPLPSQVRHDSSARTPVPGRSSGPLCPAASGRP